MRVELEEYLDEFIDRKVQDVWKGRFGELTVVELDEGDVWKWHRWDSALAISWLMCQPRTVPYGWQPYPAKGAEHDNTGVN